jgi:dTDP-4-amino-4,6-dideoxygalactose transaminase
VDNNLLKLRTHGITKNPDLLSENHGGWYHEMQTLGYNYRITGFQSALGSSQLKRADEGLERRRAIARKYNTAFQDTVVNPLAQGRNDENAYHLYVVRLNNRKEVYDKIREHGIYSQVHYIPVHLMPYYQSLGFKKGDFPNAENYYAQCLSLPMYPTLTDEEQDFVIEQVLNYAK